MEPTSLRPASFGSGRMATRVLRPTRMALLLGGVLITSAIALQLFASSAGAAAPIDASSYRLPAEDRALLIGMTFGEPPTEAVPATTAERLAAEQYDPVALGATSVDTFLETASEPGTFGTDAPVRDRAVWIVRLTGMSQEQPGPMTAEGVPAPSHFLHRAYIFIDAKTGELLFTDWQE